MNVVESRPDLYQRTLGMRGMSESLLQRRCSTLTKLMRIACGKMLRITRLTAGGFELSG